MACIPCFSQLAANIRNSDKPHSKPFIEAFIEFRNHFVVLSCHHYSHQPYIHQTDEAQEPFSVHSRPHVHRYLYQPTSTQTLHSSASVDLDLDRDRALLRLQHNQVVVIRNILNGSIDKTSPRNNLQSNQRSHDVDLAVSQARKKEKSAQRTPQEQQGE
jgi:hypothetical protein